MQGYWARFAARGVPAPAGQPQWSAFGRRSQQMISLIPPQPQVQTDFAAEYHRAFWAHTG
jgi:carboxylesterase type B